MPRASAASSRSTRSMSQKAAGKAKTGKQTRSATRSAEKEVREAARRFFGDSTRRTRSRQDEPPAVTHDYPRRERKQAKAFSGVLIAETTILRSRPKASQRGQKRKSAKKEEPVEEGYMDIDEVQMPPSPAPSSPLSSLAPTPVNSPPPTPSLPSRKRVAEEENMSDDDVPLAKRRRRLAGQSAVATTEESPLPPRTPSPTNSPAKLDDLYNMPRMPFSPLAANTAPQTPVHEVDVDRFDSQQSTPASPDSFKVYAGEQEDETIAHRQAFSPDVFGNVAPTRYNSMSVNLPSADMMPDALLNEAGYDGDEAELDGESLVKLDDLFSEFKYDDSGLFGAELYTDRLSPMPLEEEPEEEIFAADYQQPMPLPEPVNHLGSLEAEQPHVPVEPSEQRCRALFDDACRAHEAGERELALSLLARALEFKSHDLHCISLDAELRAEIAYNYLSNDQWTHAESHIAACAQSASTTLKLIGQLLREGHQAPSSVVKSFRKVYKVLSIRQFRPHLAALPEKLAWGHDYSEELLYCCGEGYEAGENGSVMDAGINQALDEYDADRMAGYAADDALIETAVDAFNVPDAVCYHPSTLARLSQAFLSKGDALNGVHYARNAVALGHDLSELREDYNSLRDAEPRMLISHGHYMGAAEAEGDEYMQWQHCVAAARPGTDAAKELQRFVNDGIFQEGLGLLTDMRFMLMACCARRTTVNGQPFLYLDPNYFL